MNCNCFNETSEALKATLESPAGARFVPAKGATLRKVSFAGSAIQITPDNNLREVCNLEFTARWSLTNGKEKEKPISVQMAFCPLCGAKLNPEP